MRPTQVPAKVFQLVAAALRRRRRVSRADIASFVRALAGPDRISAARALVDGVVVFVTLQRRGLRPLLHDRPDLPVADAAPARRVAVAVDGALAVLPVAPTCLRRSVVLLRELQRRDLGATLHIGVRSTNGHVDAHAWVQVGDEIVNDSPEVVDTYARIAAGDAERLLPTFS